MVDNLDQFGLDSPGSPPQTPVRHDTGNDGGAPSARREQLGRPADNPGSRRLMDRSPPHGRAPPIVPALEVCWFLALSRNARTATLTLTLNLARILT